jgi:hypothetical protein
MIEHEDDPPHRERSGDEENESNEIASQEQQQPDAQRQHRRRRQYHPRHYITNIKQRLRNFFRPSKRWQGLFQYIIPAVTGLLTLIVLILQWRTYRGQLKEMRRQRTEMRKSTYAATAAAKAAEAGIRKTEESSHLDQRAWIGVFGIQGDPTIGKPYEVTVELRNSGKTFANKVTIRTKTQPLEVWQIPDFDVEGDTSGVESNALVPPGGVGFGHGKTSDVKEPDLDKIEQGSIVCYTYGKVTYEDIFGCPHWTTFCYILEGDRTTGWRYTAYRSYNQADDNRCTNPTPTPTATPTATP